MRRPDFFVVGAAKSGTTALYTYLRQHPEVFMPHLKEPQFFGSDLHFVRRKRPVTTLDNYLALFAEARDEKRVGEASPLYLRSTRAAVEIKAFSPSARIIAILRNPIDMMYSLHSQGVYNATENISEFEAAIDAEDDRRCGLRIPKHPKPLEYYFYRDMVRYTSQVKRYLDVFGSANVHVIIFDDLESQPETAFRATLQFLDVSDDFVPEFLRVNSNRRVRSPTLQRVLVHPPPGVRRLGRAIVAKPFRQRFVRLLGSFNVETSPRPPMDPSLRMRLQAEFRGEVERLSALLGRDLAFWVNPA